MLTMFGAWLYSTFAYPTLSDTPLQASLLVSVALTSRAPRADVTPHSGQRGSVRAPHVLLPNKKLNSPQVQIQDVRRVRALLCKDPRRGNTLTT